jgi:prepilin-type N-terminal cleavage/methylation domain-containing protein
MSLPISPLRERVILGLVTKIKLQGSQPKASEQGVTLLECLMAIVVIGLTIAMIAPPLVIAAATRVQNRRAEQALQIAQGEVDRVRALVARDEHLPARLPATDAAINNSTNLQAVAAPTAASSFLKSSRNCTTGAYSGQQIPANQVLRVDVDGDCRADFMVQAFRSPGRTSNRELINTQNRPSEFQMGIRVYSILADGNWSNLQTLPASLQLTRGQGNQRTRPLAVLYTPFSRSDQGDSLCFYQQGQNLGAACN